MVSLHLEEAQKHLVAKCLEEHAVAVDEAFATADIKTKKLLLLEQQ